MDYSKVIFVCDYAANYAGNFIASLNRLAVELKENNKKVVFIFPKKAERKNWEINLSAYQVVFTDFNYRDLLKTIKKEIPDNKKVIIHTHFISSMFLLKLRHILSPSNSKIIFHQHMAVKFGIKQMIKGIILRLFGFKNTLYIGVSPAVFNDVCKEVGKDKARLVINSLDLTRLHITNDNKAKKNILIFGSDYKRKGVDLAISAIRDAHLEGKVKLLVVTHTPDVARVLVKTEFNNIPHFVEFVKTENNVQELYKNSFLFLSPSRMEAFGYSVIEAAYSGLRVIASDVPGQNMLKNVPNIVWIDLGNIRQLSNAILKEYSNSKENKVEQIVTRKAIEKNYSLNRWICQVIKLYGE